MDAYHLRKSEVEYELKIRGFPTAGSPVDLKKRLTEYLTNNSPILSDKVNELDPEDEIEICEERFKDLKILVADYEGNGKDNEYHRLLTRLRHYYFRAERIPLAVTPDKYLEKQKADLLKSFKEIVDEFSKLENLINTTTTTTQQTEKTEEIPENFDTRVEAVPVEEDSDEETLATVRDKLRMIDLKNKNTSAEPHNFTQPLNQRQQMHFEVESRPVPVYKWGLKFSNVPGQSIGAFLQRVEELRRARGVSEGQLFQSAVDLFDGSALIWYRSTVSRIRSWAELCKELKLVFQTPDYDDMLLQEIMNRTQGEQEPIDLFIAAIEGLYGRLSSPTPEMVRLRQILKNLNHWLQEKLCMFEITTLEQLRHMGRKAELGRLRTMHSRPPPRPNFVMEPDLAYTRNDQRKGNPHNIVQALSTQRHTSPNMKCWNCGEEGHPHAKCYKLKSLFCYGCGTSGVRKAECNRCTPKNL